MKYMFLFMVVAFAACNNNNNINNVDYKDVINLKISNRPPKTAIDCTDFIDSIEYIRLESTYENLITTISDIFISDSLLIVTEPRKGAVLFFDRQGNFLHQISKRGRGPGEYFTIGNTIIDPLSETVIIYDIEARRMLYYNFDGTYVKSINNFCDNAVIRDIISIPSGGFLCYRPDKSSVENDYDGLWETDSEGNFVRFIMRDRQKYPFLGAEHPYYLYKTSDDQIGFVSMNHTDLFKFENEELHAYISYEITGKKAKDFIGQDIPADEFNRILSVSDKGGYVVTEWLSDQGEYFITIYSKNNNTLAQGVSFQPEANGQVIFPGKTIRSNNCRLLSSYIPVEFLLSIREHESIPDNMKKAVDGLFEGIAQEQYMDMNPVLQFVYMKQ